MLTRQRRRSRAQALALFAASSLALAGCGYGHAGGTADPRPATDSASAAASNAAAERPKLPPGAKTVALSRAGDRPYDKTFDDLRFEIAPGQPFERTMLPASIEAMAGERIRIRGFMLPTAQKRGLKQFVLVRDNQECCFGPGAALYDCILVEMQDGKTAEFSIRPVAVEGTFDVSEVLGPDGTHWAIYRLDAESVR
jgi:hypothetical protein